MNLKKLLAAIMTICGLTAYEAKAQETSLFGSLTQIYLDFDQQNYEFGKASAPEFKTIFQEFLDKKISEEGFVLKTSKFDKAKELLYAKRDEQVKDEMNKLVGKQLPYKFSDALTKEIWFEITSAPQLWIDDEGHLRVNVSFKENIPEENEGYSYGISAIFVTNKAEVIAVIDPIGSEKLDELRNDNTFTDLDLGPIDIENCPEIWNAFGYVLFCTSDEAFDAYGKTTENANIYSKQRRERSKALFRDLMPEVVDAVDQCMSELENMNSEEK